MDKVQGVGFAALQPAIYGKTANTMDSRTSDRREPEDIVEISRVAQLASKVFELPEIRTELVEEVKAEIEAGTYETPERIEAAVEKLMADLYPEL